MRVGDWSKEEISNLDGGGGVEESNRCAVISKIH